MSAAQYRRLEERHDVQMPACVRTDAGRLLIGRVCDVSRSGCRLQMNRQLEIGSEVTVRLANAVERNAVIRRCEQSASGGKFDVGLELLGVCWPENILPAEDQQ
jgi:hypothetical protein